MLNSLCFIIGLFWCMLWGIYGHPLIALQGAVFLIALQLYYTEYKQDILLVGISTSFGFWFEMLLIHTNVIRYGDSNFPPLWMIAIYPLFALLVNHVFSFLKDKAPLAFLIGFMGIPSIYFWLHTQGVLSFGYSPMLAWIIIGAFWGLLLNQLLKIANLPA